MSSIIDSQATFCARARSVGVDPSVLNNFLNAGINTFAKYAFSCQYNPSMSDDAPLVEFITKANNDVAVSLGQMACLRRLFFEGHTLMVADMKSQVERTDESAPRKLPQPERASRSAAQQAKLTGLTLVGELEPAHSLIDAVMAQAEEGQLRYLPPHKCAKREAEVAALKSDNPVLVDTSLGKMVMAKQTSTPTVDTTTELKVLWAFQRRGLAYDQAELIKWETHEKWLRELFSHLARSPPAGFTGPNLHSLLRADRELFMKMAEHCRQGISIRPDGVMPLDQAMETLMFSAQVSFHLFPLPGSSSNKRDADQIANDVPRIEKRKPDASYDQQNKKVRSDKGFGKGSRTRAPTMPEQLKGMHYKTKKNERICFAFNLPGGCTGANAGGKCSKGLHVCCKPHCHKNHSLQNQD